MISGVAGAGKKSLSQWLAQVLICEKTQVSSTENDSISTNLFEEQSAQPCGTCKACNLYLHQSHPDSKSVELQAATIGVDQIRAVSRFFEKTAQLGLNQVVVIENADKMTESAANALLKTLEEPNDHSFIILQVNDEQRLLPTIISRCRHLPLKPPIGEALLKQLGQKSNDQFVNLSHLPELSDQQVLEQYQKLRSSFIQFLFDKTLRGQLTEVLIKQPHSMRWLEKIQVDLLRSHHQWRDTYSSNLINDTQMKQFLNSNKDALWQVYLVIQHYNKNILTRTQFNKELGIEKLLVDIQLLMAA